MTQPSPEPVLQLQHAWYRLMHRIGVVHPNLVSSGKLAQKQIVNIMRRG